MERRKNSDDIFRRSCATIFAVWGHSKITDTRHAYLHGVVECVYTTEVASSCLLAPRRYGSREMAFIRRKGNSFYLVHNVRRGGKVRQLHLARLGERARITDAVVKEVTRKHPFIDLNWRTLREQLDNQIDLADPESPAVQKLIHTLRSLNLDLADLFPQILRISESPAVARELLVQLQLLHSTIQVKLDQFAGNQELKRTNRVGRLGVVSPDLRGR
jgi:hypothetical protein